MDCCILLYFTVGTLIAVFGAYGLKAAVLCCIWIKSCCILLYIARTCRWYTPEAISHHIPAKADSVPHSCKIRLDFTSCKFWLDFTFLQNQTQFHFLQKQTWFHIPAKADSILHQILQKQPRFHIPAKSDSISLPAKADVNSRGGWLSQKKGCFKNVDWAWAPWLASSNIYIIWIMNPCSVHRCKFWSLPISARVLNLLWRAGHFSPQIVHSNSPTAPIWNIFHGVKFLLEKNITATKMKENGWVVGVLWGFEPFSYRTHHIRA